MTLSWADEVPGVVTLPSGRRIRGRGLREPVDVAPEPTWGIYLTGRRPPATSWESHWVPWPDFWLPRDRAAARATLLQAWWAAADGRVEVACGGGTGRTGTVLACLAVLDGVPAAEAVDFVRVRYRARAVETPWQRRYVRHFR